MPDPTGECTITDFGAEPELTRSPQRRPHVRGPGHRRRGHLAGRRHGLHPPGPAAGMAISSAVKYEVFVTGDETLREVEAGEGGFAQFSFVLDSKLADPAKSLWRPWPLTRTAIAAIARRVFRAVPKSHPLCADSLEEGTDFPRADH